jgi:hypothetical protein
MRKCLKERAVDTAIGIVWTWSPCHRGNTSHTTGLCNAHGLQAGGD